MILWNEKFNLGISTIDEQHKRWVILMNMLQESVNLSNKSEVIIEVLDQMIAYAEYHFAFEERVFEEFGFIEEGSHLQLHLDFKNNIIELKKIVDSGLIPMASTILMEMQNWLINHICNEDRKYIEFFKKNGVT